MKNKNCADIWLNIREIFMNQNIINFKYTSGFWWNNCVYWWDSNIYIWSNFSLKRSYHLGKTFSIWKRDVRWPQKIYRNFKKIIFTLKIIKIWKFLVIVCTKTCLPGTNLCTKRCLPGTNVSTKWCLPGTNLSTKTRLPGTKWDLFRVDAFWCLGLFRVDTVWCIGLFRVDTVWCWGLFRVDTFWCRLLPEFCFKVAFGGENQIFQKFPYVFHGHLPSPLHKLQVFLKCWDPFKQISSWIALSQFNFNFEK